MALVYADHPYTIITTPVHQDEDYDLFCRVASDMAIVHNMIIRGLNSIYLQAPRIRQADTTSFLKYCLAWHALLHVHHSGEEKNFFPYIEKASGKKVMDVNIAQHHAFHAGVEEFTTYLKECLTGKQKFDGEKITKLIDAFGGTLTKHLGEEIQTLLKLREFGVEKLKDLHKMHDSEGEKAMKELGLIAGLPLVFCSHDVRFEGNRWTSWPDPAPKPIKLLARHVTYWVHRDWWKFAPCNRLGHLQPLHALR